MTPVRITTTRAEDLQALGTAGQTAADSWSALRSLLLREFSPDYANLLAEPVINPARGETDWYASGTAELTPLAALAPVEQQAARAELARMAGDIRALSVRMSASHNEGERFLATMLDLAMQLPDEAHIYVQGGHPILVAWGHAKAGPAIERVYIGGELPTATRPMEILPPPAAPKPQVKHVGAALWAALGLSALALAAAVFLLLQDPLHWYQTADAACAAPPGPLDGLAALHRAEARESELRLQLAQLATDAGAKRLQCRPPESPRPPQRPPPPPPSRDEQRAMERGAKQGKVTIILAWDDRNDLDLHVLCPNSEEIFYRRRVACGGNLDVDANGDARTADVSPVENVFFTQPVPGHYRVAVDPYAMRVSRTSRFRLTIKREGRPDEVAEGVATNGQRMQEVASFDLEAAP